MGNGNQERGSLWWDVRRTWWLAAFAKIVPGFLTAGLVGYLMIYCEMNDLVHAPGILGLCKVKDEKAGQLEALQGAGRCRGSSSCAAPEHPALGQQLLQSTLRDQGLGLYDRAPDVEMDNHTRFLCAQ